MDEPGAKAGRSATVVSPENFAVGIIIAIYLGLLLVGHFSFDRSSPTPKTEDLTGSTETVILLQPSIIRAVEDKLSAEMLLVPGSEFIDPEFGVRTTEMTVQLFASNGLGEFTYSEGTAPEVVTISLWAWGDTNKYPFDTYTTSPITLSRSRVTIAMALGLCLVLLALPPTALYVAVNVVRGAKSFSHRCCFSAGSHPVEVHRWECLPGPSQNAHWL